MDTQTGKELAVSFTYPKFNQGFVTRRLRGSAYRPPDAAEDVLCEIPLNANNGPSILRLREADLYSENGFIVKPHSLIFECVYPKNAVETSGLEDCIRTIGLLFNLHTEAVWDVMEVSKRKGQAGYQGRYVSIAYPDMSKFQEAQKALTQDNYVPYPFGDEVESLFPVDRMLDRWLNHPELRNLYLRFLLIASERKVPNAVAFMERVNILKELAQIADAAGWIDKNRLTVDYHAELRDDYSIGGSPTHKRYYDSYMKYHNSPLLKMLDDNFELLEDPFTSIFCVPDEDTLGQECISSIFEDEAELYYGPDILFDLFVHAGEPVPAEALPLWNKLFHDSEDDFESLLIAINNLVSTLIYHYLDFGEYSTENEFAYEYFGDLRGLTDYLEPSYPTLLSLLRVYRGESVSEADEH